MSIKSMVLASTVMTILSVNTYGASPNLSRFVGLWEGIDSSDGSVATLEITKNEDRSVDLLVSDPHWSRCESGRGMGKGTGVATSKNTLSFDDFTIQCFESSIEPKPLAGQLILGADGSLTRTISSSNVPMIFFRIHRK